MLRPPAQQSHREAAGVPRVLARMRPGGCVEVRGPLQVLDPIVALGKNPGGAAGSPGLGLSIPGTGAQHPQGALSLPLPL